MEEIRIVLRANGFQHGLRRLEPAAGTISSAKPAASAPRNRMNLGMALSLAGWFFEV
jgi:hypothetical protein